MKHLITFVFVSLGVLVISCGVKLNDLRYGVNQYDINLRISPESKTLKVSGSIKFISSEPFCDSAVFYLHKNFEISSITGKDIDEYKFYDSEDTSLASNPGSRILHIRFKRFLEKGKSTEINFEYAGKISNIADYTPNTITNEWTEISSALPWFPYNIKHGEFVYNLKVSAPAGIEIRSSGIYSRENDSFKFSSASPVNDIPVFAAKKFYDKVNGARDYDLSLYYTDIQDSTADVLSNDLNWIMKRLRDKFGVKEKKTFTVIQSLRDIGGSHSNLGFVSLSQFYDSTYFEDREKYFKYLAYEAAKLWWWKAAHDWNEWMNEGLAEFSALILIKERYGKELFEKIISEKKDSLQGTMPVWKFSRSHLNKSRSITAANEILYIKSPIIIYQLYKMMGEERFYGFCGELIKNDVSTTKMFLNILRKREGKETANWFEQLLKNF